MWKCLLRYLPSIKSETHFCFIKKYSLKEFQNQSNFFFQTMHAYFWRDSCQDQRRSSRHTILTGRQQPESNAGPFPACGSELKKGGQDKWPFLHTRHSRLDCSHYPAGRTPLTVDITFWQGPACIFSVSWLQSNLSFQVNKYLLCIPSVPSPTLGLQGEQVWLFLFRWNLQPFSVKEHILAFGDHLMLSRRTAQWSSDSKGHQLWQAISRLFNVLFPRWRMAEHGDTLPITSPVMAQ